MSMPRYGGHSRYERLKAGVIPGYFLDDTKSLRNRIAVEHARLIKIHLVRNGYILVNPEKVYRLKMAEKWLHLFTDSGEVFTSGHHSLVSLLEEYPGLWLRCSRSEAVRLNALEYIKNDTAITANGDRVHVSRLQMKAIRAESFSGSMTVGEETRELRRFARENPDAQI